MSKTHLTTIWLSVVEISRNNCENSVVSFRVNAFFYVKKFSVTMNLIVALFKMYFSMLRTGLTVEHGNIINKFIQTKGQPGEFGTLSNKI